MSALSDSINDLKTNRKQWDAFISAGNCVVLAPPGSGKTKLLTTRMAYDLMNTIQPPHGAACITLTNAAADELSRRVDALGVPWRPTLFVGTVHGFALRQVIVPFATLLGYPEYSRPEIVSSAQKERLMNAAIREVFAHGADMRYVRSTIDVNRQRLAPEEHWALSGLDVREAARRYEDKLMAEGMIDFQQLIAIAVDFVENHSIVRKVLAARYPRLFVDEYQDLAPGLDRLVRAMCFNYRTDTELFAVGDPDQALFSFTGTRPELLQQLAEHPMVDAVHLDQNYRCRPEIIDVANRLLPGRGRQAGLTACVSATECPAGFVDQCQHALVAIQNAMAVGTPLHEIAVICPTNDQCRQAAEVLKAGRISTIVREDNYRQTNLTSLIEAFAAWAVLGREQSGYRLGSLISRYRSALGTRWTRTTDGALVQILLNNKETSATAASSFIQDILDLGLREALSRPSLADEAVELKNMESAYLVGPLSDQDLNGLADRARKTERVEITTMTSSKGLEFDIVLILGVDEGQVPFFSSVRNPELMAEERRKLYVSVTRARDRVAIFYSGFVQWSKGPIRRDGPSRFLREMRLI